MTDLHGIEPVGNERVAGEFRHLGRSCDLDAVRIPAGADTDKEGGNGGCDSCGNRAVTTLRNALDIQPSGRRFVDHMAETLANELHLPAPCSNLRGILGMCGEPCLDGAATIGRQLVIDVGIKLCFAHNMISVCHSLASSSLHAAKRRALAI